MKRKWMAVVGIVFLAAQVSGQQAPALEGQQAPPKPQQAPAAPKTPKEAMSYGIGVEVARNFQRLGLDLDLEVLIKALRDVYSGGKLLMSEEDLRAAKSVYQPELMAKQVAAVGRTAEENKKAGIAFLAANKGKDGVVTLPSGLQYKILRVGDGKTPTAADTVECNYRGTLLDGTEFDSSYRRGEPAKLKLTAIIQGWRDALQLMPVGSRWQLFIPPELAYGERGNGRNIGPNATLVFEMEILAIK
jgi:FKBP-type peptidyl-prolyl cis-trans isomerase